MNKHTAKENCTDCNTPSTSSLRGAIGAQTEGMANPGNTPASDSQFTYDDGQGVKNKVVLTGPLSELLSQQLAVTFSKTPIGEPQDSAGDNEDASSQPALVTGLNQAQETIAIDSAVAEAFGQLENQIDNQVLLQNFDVTSLKAHLARVENGLSDDHDRLASVAKVSALVVGTPQELLETDVDEVMNAVGCANVDFLIVKETKPGDQTTKNYNDVEGGPMLINGKVISGSPPVIGDAEDPKSHGQFDRPVEEISSDYLEESVLRGNGQVFASLESYFKHKAASLSCSG